MSAWSQVTRRIAERFQRLRQIALRHQHVADLGVGHRQVALPAVAGVGLESAYSPRITRILKRTCRPDQKLIIVAHRDLSRRQFMQRMFLASFTIALAAVSASVAIHAQGQQPTFATTKVTDNVYYFRYCPGCAG
jgi:hypothetical protein